MALTVMDRSPDLLEALLGVARNNNHQEAMYGAAMRGMELTLFTLRRNAPVGQTEPSWSWDSATGSGTVNHGRPSIRQHGMTLDSAWTQEMERISHGAAFTVYNRAPHTMWVIYGTPGHTITAHGDALAFWWGDPLKWSPKDGLPAGPRYYPQVDHPGAMPNLFVHRTATEVRPRLRELTRQGAQQGMKSLRNFFYGRGRLALPG